MKSKREQDSWHQIHSNSHITPITTQSMHVCFVTASSRPNNLDMDIVHSRYTSRMKLNKRSTDTFLMLTKHISYWNMTKGQCY